MVEYLDDKAVPPNPNPGPGKPVAASGFQQRFFTLDPEAASKDAKGNPVEYDIIIIGTGIGGGVVAGDLFDTNSKIGENAKNILVIERGNLVFHSHCLNASRPSGLGEDRGQQNDTFFDAFKRDFPGALESAGGPTEWKGGPMYCVGGRSAAWGLFAPRVHDKTLDRFFPPVVKEELLKEYYDKAELLMKLSLPVTKPYHQAVIDRLNMEADDSAKVQWQWGRIASEFSDSRNFDFAEGAYSTIDKLLEIAMSKPKEGGVEVEHKKFKILLGVEVRRIEWKSDNKTAAGVLATIPGGKQVSYKLSQGGRVIVSAGSVDSPAILLRSGVDLPKMGGGHITDHDIYFHMNSFRYRTPADRQEVGAMKLQTYAFVDDDIVLVNMSIDASTFLPRSKNTYDDLPKFIMVFIMRSPLVSDNEVKLVSDEPMVTIQRSKHDGGNRVVKLKAMQSLTVKSMAAISDALKIDFIPEQADGKKGEEYFKKLQLGGVAHELGTIPMSAPHLSKHCLDTNLKLAGREGVYVCDLSIFPYSPEANPTLTLAALSLRLSRTLVPRLTITLNANEGNYVCIVNHSGRPISVFVSNRANVAMKSASGQPVQNSDVELTEGQYEKWERGKGKAECVFVRRIDPKWDGKDRKKIIYSDVPEVFVATPGNILPIL